MHLPEFSKDCCQRKASSSHPDSPKRRGRRKLTFVYHLLCNQVVSHILIDPYNSFLDFSFLATTFYCSWPTPGSVLRELYAIPGIKPHARQGSYPLCYLSDPLTQWVFCLGETSDCAQGLSPTSILGDHTWWWSRDHMQFKGSNQGHDQNSYSKASALPLILSFLFPSYN